MEGSKDHDLSQFGQEAVEAGDLRTLLKIWGNQWHPKDNPDGYLSLGVAENNLMHKPVAEYIQKNFTFSGHALTYGEGGMGSSRTRIAIARFLNRHLKPVKPIEKAHVVETNGCTSAIEHCAFMLSNPDEYFLLGQPYYGSFIPDITLRTKTKVILVPFGDIDPISLEAVQCYENAIKEAQSQGKKVKALMLCHPHNPLGRCYPVPALKALMSLCQTHRIHFISDEIYALSVWTNKEDQSPPPIPFSSVLSINPDGLIDPHLVHVLWGMSKDFAANGIRLGVIISQSNPSFIEALRMVSLYSCPSSLTDIITGTILEDDAFTEKYIIESQSALSESYSRAVQILRTHKIEYMPGANAAFFLWINLGKAYIDRHPEAVAAGLLRDETALATMLMQTMLEKEKVFLASGKAFGGEKPGWFRIVFAQSEDYLVEGMRRVVAALEYKHDEEDNINKQNEVNDGNEDKNKNGIVGSKKAESVIGHDGSVPYPNPDRDVEVVETGLRSSKIHEE